MPDRVYIETSFVIHFDVELSPFGKRSDAAVD